MSDPVEIINRFTEFNPSKGEEPLPLPIPGHWFRKICALADRIAAAENELEKYRGGHVLSEEQRAYLLELVLNEHRAWLLMDVQSSRLMEKRTEMIAFTADLAVILMKGEK